MKKSGQRPKSETLRQFDREVLGQGFRSLAGVDEAGRGPLAGPVVAAAVLVRDFSFSEEIDDSKKMTPKKRERAFEEIKAKCDVSFAIVDVADIDRLNIFQATMQAMKRAVEGLAEVPHAVLVDGNRAPHLGCRTIPVVDGDAKSFSIACASIIAKVTRDRLMDEYHGRYPLYGFGKHKGYGTSEHVAAIRQHGPCEIHRRSFEPVKTIVDYGNPFNH